MESIAPGHLAIPNLMFRYADLIDSGNFAGVGELFADGVIEVTETGATYTGRDEVRSMYQDWVRIYPDNGTPHTKHVTTNLQLAVDEDAGTATCTAYVMVLQSTEELPLQPILSGRYFDDFVRLDGEWRFRRRRMTNEYLGDLSQHLIQPFANDGAR